MHFLGLEGDSGHVLYYMSVQFMLHNNYCG